jgi:hypothetical protein
MLANYGKSNFYHEIQVLGASGKVGIGGAVSATALLKVHGKAEVNNIESVGDVKTVTLSMPGKFNIDSDMVVTVDSEFDGLVEMNNGLNLPGLMQVTGIGMTIDTPETTINSTILSLLNDALRVKDKIPVLNYEQTGTPTGVVSGIEVELGTEANQQIVFDRDSGYWEIGTSGGRQRLFPVVDGIANNAILKVNTAAKRLEGADSPSWTSIPLESSLSGTAKYYKDPFGFVHLRGYIDNIGVQTHIATMPVGARPPATSHHTCRISFTGQTGGSDQAEFIEIETNGEIYQFENAETYYLDGISYYVG